MQWPSTMCEQSTRVLALAKLTHLLLGRGLVLGQTVDVVAKGGNLVVDVAVAARLVGASGGVGLCARSRQ